ncbi:universal stress protein [Candidatus Bathyarchaeota archaeon]|nr:universal stress protein [Candidatus Bathyarchaeota archaeon]
MNKQESKAAIRRILVALDASSHSLAALEAAAELAARMEAELLGLFVEDINILQLAELPFAQGVSYPFTVGQQLDKSKMERALKVKAEQARRALATTAKQLHVRWSFRTVRGYITSEVLEAALEADLLTLGKSSRQLARRVELGSTAREAIARAPRPVLLVQHGVSIKQPVLVVYDGSESAKQALATGADMAQAYGDGLVVLILAEISDVAQRLENEVTAWLQGRKLQVGYRWLDKLDAQSLIQTIQTERGGILILGSESSDLSLETIQEILEKINCPVLLIRH